MEQPRSIHQVVLLEKGRTRSDPAVYVLKVDEKDTRVKNLQEFLVLEKKYIAAALVRSIDKLEYWLQDDFGNTTIVYRYENGMLVEVPEYKAGVTQEGIYG